MRKILIADDSYESRIEMAAALRDKYRAVTVENGKEALDILETEGDFDVVLLDLIMPVLDGLSTLKRIKESPNLKDIRVIVLATGNSVENQISALDQGAVGILMKPINLDLMRMRVERLITGTPAEILNDKQEHYERLTNQNGMDPKSGIFNRSTFCKEAEKLIKANPDKEYILFCWDIDGFKLINDMYGVDEGDRYLAEVGALHRIHMLEGIRFGRWEADRFVMLIEKKLLEPSLFTARVEKELAKRFNFKITIRMGIYSVENSDVDVQLMCDRAVLALKSTKGKFETHIAYYDESMRTELIEQSRITEDMETSLAKGEFIVYLQPQVDYASGKLHGCEALVRWQHPLRGLIPPDRFIPVFEKNGFITRLDRYVWEEVCRFQRSLINEGLNILPISINVSRADIHSLSLERYLEMLCRKYSLDHSCLKIEITESAYMDNPEQLVKAVTNLKAAGFSVEMDDFGSGYSSLNTLKDVPVDMLKLDMKFVQAGTNEHRGGVILSSVIRMAKWLQLPVIAEGVETAAQAEYLKSMGCTLMQGYFFAKPMPFDAYRELVKKNHEEEKVVSVSNNISDATAFLSSSTQAALLFNSFVGGAAIMEYDGVRPEIIRTNDRFLENIELTYEQYSGKPNIFYELFDKRYKEILCYAVETAITTKMESSCDLMFKNKYTDSDVWLQIRIRFLADIGGRSIMYLSTENTTQRMGLFLSNLSLKNRLNAILNSAPGGIIEYVVSNGSMRLIYFNDRAAQLFGYSREEYEKLFLNHPFEVVYPEDIPECVNTFNAMKRHEIMKIDICFRHICKDGSYKWVELSGIVTDEVEDEIYGSLMIMDIQAKMDAEERSVQTEILYAKRRALMGALSRLLPYGIIEFVAKGKKLELFDFNDKVWMSLGYSSAEEFMKECYNPKKKTGLMGGELARIMSFASKLLNGPEDRIESIDITILGKNGTPQTFNVDVQKVVLNETTYIQSVFRLENTLDEEPEKAEW